jgi:hypothetical protein
MAAPTVLFVFVITDPAMATGILDLVTGKSEAELAAISAQSEDALKMAQAIDTRPPDPSK